MTLTLNTTSGVLHRSARCAGQDTRWHVPIHEHNGEKVVAILQSVYGTHEIRARCRKCNR